MGFANIKILPCGHSENSIAFFHGKCSKCGHDKYEEFTEWTALIGNRKAVRCLGCTNEAYLCKDYTNKGE